MFGFLVLENLLTINYFNTLKPSLVGAPYNRKECNSFYYALILIGLLVKGKMVVQLMMLWHNKKKNAHLKTMQMHCVKWRTGYATTWSAKFSFKWICNHSYMKIWLILLQANLMQVPCKMQNATMDNDVKSKCFLYFLN